MKSAQYLVIFFLLILESTSRIQGNLESTYGRCCALGANWGRESQKCNLFPDTVPGVPLERQIVCRTTASICCLRYYREIQCENAKQAAKSGQNCISKASEPGGEFFKDCCDGCKLGLITGNSAKTCEFRGFSFGYPWNDAYLDCCIHASPTGSIKNVTQLYESNALKNNRGSRTQALDNDDENFLFLNRIDGKVEIPDDKNLCLSFSGILCSHICVPTHLSYVCQCRDGFTLSIIDKKTCFQDVIKDRCEVNNPCDHICRDTGVSIECSCRPGYHLRADKQTCDDINECITGNHNCIASENCVNIQGGFNCESKSNRKPSDCPAGYKFDSDKGNCEDIDECAEKLDNCAGGVQTCVNLVGSFKCIPKKLLCDFGYKFDEQLQSCQDVDECSEGSYVCNEGREKCFNLIGGYKCVRIETPTTKNPDIDDEDEEEEKTDKPTRPKCPEGHTYNIIHRSCTDIDECKRDICDRDTEICVNSQGSYKCQCKPGFTKNVATGECIDMNECQLGLHNCEALQRCDNTVGSYTCTRLSGCGTGYTLNFNTGVCEDNDECSLNRNDCHQLGPKWVCINTKGSFRCEKKKCPPKQLLNSWGVCVEIKCTPGFKPLKRRCVDVNECFEDDFPCKANEHCVNRIGTFNCRPKINCGRGYRMNDDGTQCLDVDECGDGSHTCSEGQFCTNRPGGYVCQCPQGYRLDASRKCQDVNECRTAYVNLCGNTGECENTPGSYKCNCRNGFKKASDGKTCIDIDECREINGICDHNCFNIWGSHYCSCNVGYNLADDKKSCQDIDECEEIRGKGRLCLGICVNTPGTFKCSCPSGYRLESDQRTCKDVNECDTTGICRDPKEVCVNTRGKYRCQKITCPPNYIIDNAHQNRCKRKESCREDDYACIQEPLTYSYNFLPLSSNMTIRPQDQVDLFTMRGPLWSSTNVKFQLELASVNAPANIPPATRNYFTLNRTSYNQVVLTLIKSLQGPQEIQLKLLMKLYYNGYYEGSAVANLLIFVSEYDF